MRRVAAVIRRRSVLVPPAPRAPSSPPASPDPRAPAARPAPPVGPAPSLGPGRALTRHRPAHQSARKAPRLPGAQRRQPR
ncbi:hypothetical protein ACFPRL_04615 [Pseudoclavibacter helvolus]